MSGGALVADFSGLPIGIPVDETLLLVPTDFELGKLLDSGLETARFGMVRICGFGPLSAVLETSRLLFEKKYRRVVLAGIAGTFDPNLPLGTAISFNRVLLDGIGVEIGVNQGGRIKTGRELGFQPSLADAFDLYPFCDTEKNTLLTVCIASGSPVDRQRRLEFFPGVVAEDMEGFAVAAACQERGLPLNIVRGLSNLVGDRDKANWRIDLACEAVAKYLNQRY